MNKVSKYPVLYEGFLNKVVQLFHGVEHLVDIPKFSDFIEGKLIELEKTYDINKLPPSVLLSTVAEYDGWKLDVTLSNGLQWRFKLPLKKFIANDEGSPITFLKKECEIQEAFLLDMLIDGDELKEEETCCSQVELEEKNVGEKNSTLH